MDAGKVVPAVHSCLFGTIFLFEQEAFFENPSMNYLPFIQKTTVFLYLILQAIKKDVYFILSALAIHGGGWIPSVALLKYCFNLK